MTDLAEAWTRVLSMVERPDGAVLREEDDGTRLDWRPDGAETLRDDGATAWLRHTLFRPLTEQEMRALERQAERDLPDPLRRFYLECSNGLDLLGGDVAVYGLRRDGLLNPFELWIETQDVPEDAPADAVFFGSWGGENHPVYLDEGGRVHLSGLRSATSLRSWPDLGAFLVSTLEQGLECCWDAEGRRIGDLPVPEETAKPPVRTTRPFRAPEGLEARAEEVATLLDGAPATVQVGESTFELIAAAQLGDAQVGFAVDPGGDSLTGDRPGDWRPEWIVVGTDADLGDPLFVDLRSTELPVLTAMHGEGDWDPEEVAPSLRDLLSGGGAR